MDFWKTTFTLFCVLLVHVSYAQNNVKAKDIYTTVTPLHPQKQEMNKNRVQNKDQDVVEVADVNKVIYVSSDDYPGDSHLRNLKEEEVDIALPAEGPSPISPKKKKMKTAMAKQTDKFIGSALNNPLGSFGFPSYFGYAQAHGDPGRVQGIPAGGLPPELSELFGRFRQPKPSRSMKSMDHCPERAEIGIQCKYIRM